MSDGTMPLTEKRAEKFAQARAKGVSQAEAYKATIPFGTAHSGDNASLRVSGHRLEKRPDVASRIAFLRKQARSGAGDTNKPLTKSEVVAISLEVSQTLESTYKAALSSSVSPQALERLKAVLAAHLARQGKLDDETTPLSDDTDVEISTMMNRIELGGCTCQPH